MTVDDGSRDRYQRARDIVEACLDASATDRDRLLQERCQGDPALRAEVDWMMRAARTGAPDDPAAFDAAAWLDGSTFAAAPSDYHLERPLGEGGAGMVYLAVRRGEGVQHRVAVKLLRMAGPASGLRRFRDEQRILATLAHAHIARFIDAGLLADGRPYLAMEYVDGLALDRWSEGRSLAERLDVFLDVCSAVAHAHAQLVMHGDLKPGNVLVTAEGHAKLLDFGIARLLDGGNAMATASRVLTPVYASPEQIEGGALGTATDIYSLGAVLYGLVAGHRPFSSARSESAVLHAVVAGELEPPSRIARVPADLEAIVLKAMRREPAHRYASVAELSDDVRRFQSGRPVLARRGSTAYRVRRQVWRHRYGVAAGAFVVLAVVAAFAATLRSLAETRAQRDRTDRINAFFHGVLAAADPADMGRDATIVAALERAQQKTASALDGDPDTAALTGLTLARTFQQLGRYDAAVDSAQGAIEAARRAADDGIGIDARITLGVTLWNQGKYDLAAERLEEAVARAANRGTKAQLGEATNRLGEVEFSRGRVEAARVLQLRALEITPLEARRTRGFAYGDLASIAYRQGDVGGALVLNAQSIAHLRELAPRGDLTLATQLGNRGAMLTRLRRFGEAEAVLVEALNMRIGLYGERHRTAIDAMTKLAQLRLEQGDIPGALAHSERAYRVSTPLANYVAARAAKVHATVLVPSDRRDEALAVARTAVSLYEASYADDYDELLDARSVLGWVLAQSGERTAGQALAAKAWERLAASKPQDRFTVEARKRLDVIEALAR